MDFVAVLVIVVIAWLVVAVVLALILGRMASSAEHDRRMSALTREVRDADRARDARQDTRSTDEQRSEGTGTAV